MRIAHLIMAHKGPEQLARLVKALAHEGFDFYIHLDAKADRREFAFLEELPGVRLTTTRLYVRWASYRFTKAIVECTREILATGIEYDFINLMSAQDYPIKPAETIYDFLARNRGRSFLSFESSEENSEWWAHAITRVEKYHSTYFHFKGQYFLQATINWLLPKRTFPLPYTLYGGKDGSWWTISRPCAQYLVDFLDNNPGLRRFTMFTWGSDEFLISTILMNSPYRPTIVNNNYRYIDWSQGGANPKVLTTVDFEALRASPQLFARKFDPEVDATVLDLVDDLLLAAPLHPVS
ncbi:beta-1,6-N-acetylglucosaminyltransferase [Hymenobacter sublimis]|uniref:Peptide O-xylosyltransferase n=1 Tax=Hymenobacter sublimis TaxID=2933777 RepID=A0ABY4JG43_9BACT|nr:beta-1,6-N-acetylglucosaminyltransferase [Hymenobacter sublimis]UPL50877.1 beta-1,6-N-acetylglucosaminyltransferase [Hymenobacter sublimis]